MPLFRAATQFDAIAARVGAQRTDAATGAAASPARRRLLQLGMALGTALVLSTQFAGEAHAQTKVRFQLDWRFEGP